MAGIVKNLKHSENPNFFEAWETPNKPQGNWTPSTAILGTPNISEISAKQPKFSLSPFTAGPSITFGGCNFSALILSASRISCVCFGSQGLPHQPLQVLCLAGHCSSRCHPQPVPSTISCWGLFYDAEEMGAAVGALPGFINQKGLPSGSVLSSKISKPPRLVQWHFSVRSEIDLLSAFLVNINIPKIYLNTLDRWLLLIWMEVVERGYIGSSL